MNYTFNEGDNITVTAEFIDYLEDLEKAKLELEIYRGSLKREHEAIHRANDLEDRWNELKKWLEEEITKLRDFPLQDVERVAKRISLERTLKKLNKLEELEGDKE